MINRDIVVRIIQPLDKVQPINFVSSQELPLEAAQDYFHHSLNALGLAAITALGVFLVVSFFNLGIAWKDIAIMIGIPLVLGLVTSYSI